MKFATLATSVGLLTLAFYIVYVSSGSDKVAMRVAALAYAFDHDPSPKGANLNISLSCDEETEGVIAALAKHPAFRGRLKIRARGDGSPTEGEDAGRLVYWRIEITTNESGEVFATIGCVKGPDNGYGRLIRMKKSFGRWLVVSSTYTWVS